jgi:hypothetical protein
MYTLKCSLLFSVVTKAGMCTQILIAGTKTKFHENPFSNFFLRVTCDKTDIQEKVKLRSSFLPFSFATSTYSHILSLTTFLKINQFIKFSF